MNVQHAIGMVRIPYLSTRLLAMLALALATGAPCLAQSVNDGQSMLRDARHAAGYAAKQRNAPVDRYATPASYEAEEVVAKPIVTPPSKEAPAAKSTGKLLPPKPGSAQPVSEGGEVADAATAATGYPSATTLIGSTCVVLSVFFATAWVLKRAAPRSMRGLPREAIELLGRTQLVRGQQMHLVRCGNRLLLLAVSATTSQTLAEISDPQEVESLLMACGAHSTPHAPREAEHHTERNEYPVRSQVKAERVSDLLESVTGSAARPGRRAPARGSMAALVGEGRHV